MQTDASKKKLRSSVSRDMNWGPVVKEGTGVSYKSFRTFNNKICTSNLQQNDEFQISIYPTRQPNCFQLPLKDGRDKEPGTSQSFEGDLGLSSQISDLPGCLNHQADWESRNQKDSTEWKLCPQVFQKICQVGQPEIDLFASRLSNQLPAYYPWKPDPNCLTLDALQQTWYHKHLYTFLHFH